MSVLLVGGQAASAWYVSENASMHVVLTDLAVAKYNTIHFHETLELRYRFLPYQLNPTLTEDPVPRMEHLRKKFGEKKAGAISALIGEKLAKVGYEV
jgi:predicted DsbA family dithiol-disulfide isomerase